MKKLLMLALALMIAVGIFATDMEATKINGHSAGIAAQDLSFSVTVKNTGSTAVSSYNVYLKKYGAERLICDPSSAALEAGESAVHSFTWSINSDNVYFLVGEVELVGDSNSSNNETAAKRVVIFNQDTTSQTVGDLLTSFPDTTLPTGVNNKSCVTETIYKATEMDMISETIVGLFYFKYTEQDVLDNHIKIWVKNTAASDLSDGWLPFAGYTLVFDDLIDFLSTDEYVFIPFSSPITYTGGNFAIRMNRVDTESSSLFNAFMCNTPTPEDIRSIYIVSDDTVHDPTNPGLSGPGTLVNSIPITVFLIDNAGIVELAQPEVTITKVGTTVTLNWAEIPNADAYKVFASNEPDVFPDNPITTVYTNSYTASMGNAAMKFYKVVAITN